MTEPTKEPTSQIARFFAIITGEYKPVKKPIEAEGHKWSILTGLTTAAARIWRSLIRGEKSTVTQLHKFEVVRSSWLDRVGDLFRKTFMSEQGYHKELLGRIKNAVQWINQGQKETSSAASPEFEPALLDHSLEVLRLAEVEDDAFGKMVQNVNQQAYEIVKIGLTAAHAGQITTPGQARDLAHELKRAIELGVLTFPDRRGATVSVATWLDSLATQWAREMQPVTDALLVLRKSLKDNAEKKWSQIRSEEHPFKPGDLAGDDPQVVSLSSEPVNASQDAVNASRDARIRFSSFSYYVNDTCVKETAPFPQNPTLETWKKDYKFLQTRLLEEMEKSNASPAAKESITQHPGKLLELIINSATVNTLGYVASKQATGFAREKLGLVEGEDIPFSMDLIHSETTPFRLVPKGNNLEIQYFLATKFKVAEGEVPPPIVVSVILTADLTKLSSEPPDSAVTNISTQVTVISETTDPYVGPGLLTWAARSLPEQFLVDYAKLLRNPPFDTKYQYLVPLILGKITALARANQEYYRNNDVKYAKEKALLVDFLSELQDNPTAWSELGKPENNESWQRYQEVYQIAVGPDVPKRPSPPAEPAAHKPSASVPHPDKGA